MKSIIVVSPYGSEHGPRRTLEHVVRAVTLAGFRPICVVPSLDAISPELGALEPDVRVIPSLDTLHRTLDPRVILRLVRAHRAAAAAIARIARSEDAAAIFTISEGVLAGGIAARRAGVPSATHVIGLSIRSPRLLARAYVPLLNRFSSRFVACSTAVATMLTDNGVDRDAIDLVHNSISLNEMELSAQHPSPLPLSGPSVGMVAAYDPRKGHDLFVAAAALIAQSHPDARFYLIGGVLDNRPESAAFEQAVRRLIEAKGLTGRLEQVGVVASSERYPWIRALDVVVAPSRTEGFAYALLEAMACARPIVATAIEGNLDAIVDGESGLLVEVTPGAIAAGISSLLADPIRGAALGQAAYLRVAARFDDRVAIPLLAQAVAAVASIDVADDDGRG
jgi:glycosyltransferase involved in cell wall biosynthesis